MAANGTRHRDDPSSKNLSAVQKRRDWPAERSDEFVCPTGSRPGCRRAKVDLVRAAEGLLPPHSCGETGLVGRAFAFRNRPGALISPAEERAARMNEEHLDQPLAVAVKEKAGARRGHILQSHTENKKRTGGFTRSKPAPALRSGGSPIRCFRGIPRQEHSLISLVGWHGPLYPLPQGPLALCRFSSCS
jgi:hypothetical protein